jgi:hypothetical protein
MNITTHDRKTHEQESNCATILSAQNMHRLHANCTQTEIVRCIDGNKTGTLCMELSHSESLVRKLTRAKFDEVPTKW